MAEPHDVSHKGMFEEGAEWEDIDPAELETVAEPGAEAKDEAEDDDGALAAKVEAEPEETDEPTASAAANRPDGRRGRYAEEHRKLVRDYRIGKKKLAVTDLAGRRIGYANRRSPDLRSDRKISVDLNTVVGSRRNHYRNAYVLVWKGTDDGKPSNDPTGWIKVGKLPRRAQRDIAEVQNEKRREQRRGSGGGHKARTTGERLALAPQNPESITEKFVPRPGGSDLEAFRIAGGGVDDETGDRSSTPLANYTHNPARYGDNVVVVWNPPGSSSGGKRNIGSGGIRAFLPLSTEIEVCDVKPIVISNADRDVGTGTCRWIYATARINGQRIYFWLLRSWSFTERAGADGMQKQRDGSNV